MGFVVIFKLQFGGKNSTLFFTSSSAPFYATHAGYQASLQRPAPHKFFSHKDHNQEQKRINDHKKIKKCCSFTLERLSIVFTANGKRRICTT